MTHKVSIKLEYRQNYVFASITFKSPVAIQVTVYTLTLMWVVKFNFVKKIGCAMSSLLHEMRLHGIMLAVFIILDWQASKLHYQNKKVKLYNIIY